MERPTVETLNARSRAAYPIHVKWPYARAAPKRSSALLARYIVIATIGPRLCVHEQSLTGKAGLTDKIQVKLPPGRSRCQLTTMNHVIHSKGRMSCMELYIRVLSYKGKEFGPKQENYSLNEPKMGNC